MVSCLFVKIGFYLFWWKLSDRFNKNLCKLVMKFSSDFDSGCHYKMSKRYESSLVKFKQNTHRSVSKQSWSYSVVLGVEKLRPSHKRLECLSITFSCLIPLVARIFIFILSWLYFEILWPLLSSEQSWLQFNASTHVVFCACCFHVCAVLFSFWPYALSDEGK